MTYLRNGTTVDDPRLDRLVHFDERSRKYPVTLVAPAPRKDHIWRLDRSRMGDQGSEGACVEFGIVHGLLAQPAPSALKLGQRIRSAHLIYWNAQRRDPWEGGSYPGATPEYEGTSVLAGIQVAKDYGFFDAYYWAFNMDQAVRGILTVSPGIAGLNWTTGMSKTTSSGLIEATGKPYGGHCVAIIGIDYGKRFPNGRVLDVAVIAQSWGLDYGDRGRVYLPLNQLGERLADDGELAFTTGRHPLQTVS